MHGERPGCKQYGNPLNYSVRGNKDLYIRIVHTSRDSAFWQTCLLVPATAEDKIRTQPHGGWWVEYVMMTSSNGNIFRVTGHLCGEFTGPRWIPHTKASDIIVMMQLKCMSILTLWPPERCGNDFTSVFLTIISRIDILHTFCESDLRGVPQNHINVKSRLNGEMARNHYPRLCWPTSIWRHWATMN